MQWASLVTLIAITFVSAISMPITKTGAALVLLVILPFFDRGPYFGDWHHILDWHHIWLTSFVLGVKSSRSALFCVLPRDGDEGEKRRRRQNARACAQPPLIVTLSLFLSGFLSFGPRGQHLVVVANTGADGGREEGERNKRVQRVRGITTSATNDDDDHDKNGEGDQDDA